MKRYWIWNKHVDIPNGLYDEDSCAFLQTMHDAAEGHDVDYWLEGSELPDWYVYLLTTP